MNHVVTYEFVSKCSCVKSGDQFMKRLSGSIVVALMVSGCATTLTQAQYVEAASIYMRLSKCEKHHGMNPEVAQKGRAIINDKIRDTADYNSYNWNSLLQAAYNDPTVPGAVDCMQLDSFVRNKIDYDSRPSPSIPTYTYKPPTTTYCSRIGVSTICNSY